MTTATENPALSAPAPPRGRWYNSLRFRMYFRFFASIAIMVAATFIVMMKAGREVLHQYAFRYTEQMGNTRIAEIGQHVAQIETLAQGMAHMVSRSIRGGQDLVQNVETVLDALGYTRMVAGATISLQPNVLPDQPRVLMWQSTESGRLVLAAGRRSVASPLYSAARYVPHDRVLWSETLTHPPTDRVAVQGYVPIYDGTSFLGVVMLDIDLSRLKPLLLSSPSPSGYAFAVDRGNRPIFNLNELGADAAALVDQPEVAAMFSRVDEGTRDLLASEPNRLEEFLRTLPKDMAQRAQTTLTQAMLLDVLAAQTAESRLLLRAPVQDDPVLGENGQVFVFHIPRTYWKLIVVKPESAIMTPTQALAGRLLAVLILIMVVPLAVVFLLFRRDFTGPVRYMSRALMGGSGTQGELLQGMRPSSVNELVGLAYAFDRRTEALRDANVRLTREIEGRVRTENALRDVEARFRNVLENTRDLLYKLNLQTRHYEYVSPAAEEITGFTPEELIAMGAEELVERIHPEDRPLIHAHFKQLIAGDSTAASLIEYRWRHRDGSYVWASENRSLVRNKHGEPVALIGSTRDVTGRKAAERELLRARRYLQSIIDSMPSILIGVDRECRVTHWNQQAARVTGRAAQDVLRQPFYTAFPLDHELVDRVCDAVARGEPLESARLRTTSPEGEDRHSELMVYPLVVDGVEGAVIRIDDVSSRVQIEEMMVQTEKMMSVGGLAAGMAHEINNPLGGILQACQNIERRTSPDLPVNHKVAQELGVSLDAIHAYMERRKVFEFIRGIRADGTRAAKIIVDMLAFSRRSESKFAPVDFPDLLNTVIRLAANDYDLKKHYDFKRIRIVREFDPELEVIRCDRAKMEQVLLNLIKNSAQAMAFAEHEAIDPTLTIRTAREREHVRIEIADNGPGMDEKTRRRAFEPFFTTKEVGVGTGLGLSVSYFIITKQHKGAMSVESAPGKGARFIIRLPLDLKE